MPDNLPVFCSSIEYRQIVAIILHRCRFTFEHLEHVLEGQFGSVGREHRRWNNHPKSWVWRLFDDLVVVPLVNDNI